MTIGESTGDTPPFYDVIRGQIFHSTGAAEFVSIAQAGVIRRGLNSSPAGFCQRADGLGAHLGPCLSLSDLSIVASEDELFSGDTEWQQQIYKPWGVACRESALQFEEPVKVSVTMIFDRERLISAKTHCYSQIVERYPQHVDRWGVLLYGHFIPETEVCYADDIPTSAIKQLLIVCSRSTEWYTVRAWDEQDKEKHIEYVKKIERRIKRVIPPRINGWWMRPNANQTP